MDQHMRANSSGQDSTVCLHLEDKGHSFEDSKEHILDREDKWFERALKEAIYVNVEKTSFNRGGGCTYQPLTMPPFLPFSGFLTPIHTWIYVTLMTTAT